MIAQMRNKMLYEIRPDLFPQRMTDLERELWEKFYAERQRERKT